jgi:NTP pyrophosphatase (non-canonical NTP hydrolase)
MEQKLRKHDAKKGQSWGDDGADDLMVRLDEETQELRDAIRRSGNERGQEIIDEAADVANFAMMIADNAFGTDADARYAAPSSPPPTAEAGREGLEALKPHGKPFEPWMLLWIALANKRDGVLPSDLWAMEAEACLRDAKTQPAAPPQSAWTVDPYRNRHCLLCGADATVWTPTCQSCSVKLGPAPSPPADPALGEALSLAELRHANVTRQSEWDRDGKIDLSYRGNELAGEVGEACNVVKKLERERLGIRGSRDTVAHLAEELADVVICVDLIAAAVGIQLDAAVRSKFNATSEKNGLKTRLRAAAPRPEGGGR